MKFILVTILIAIGVALSVWADMVLKKNGWGDWKYLLAGFLIYGVVSVPVAIAFRYTQFGQLFLVWEAVAVMFGILVASFYYKEAFTSYRFIALILALGALVFAYI